MRYDEDIQFIAVTIVYIAVYKYLWQGLVAIPIINMVPFHFLCLIVLNFFFILASNSRIRRVWGSASCFISSISSLNAISWHTFSYGVKNVAEHRTKITSRQTRQTCSALLITGNKELLIKNLNR